MKWATVTVLSTPFYLSLWHTSLSLWHTSLSILHTSSVPLVLRISLTFTAIHISGTTYVEKNQRLVLRCNASSDSYPQDDLDWFMNGHKVESSDTEGITITKSVAYRSQTIWSELVIAHARMQHAGTYICRTSDKLVTNIKVNILNGEWILEFMWRICSQNFFFSKNTINIPSSLVFDNKYFW